MSIRGRQVATGLAGLVVTLVLLWLGLWQMQVFRDREDANAATRASQPPVALLDYVAGDGTVGDVYGRQVSVEGRYLAGQQVAVVAADGSVRVLSALELADGRVLPVVRGSLPAGTASAELALPVPPSGTSAVAGVFLPSEEAADHAVPVGSYGSVRLPLLAQQWNQQLLPGFVTLDAAAAASQGLTAASVTLPTGDASLQNLGYALQWWVFAGFAAFMTWHFLRVIGRTGGIGTLADQEEP